MKLNSVVVLGDKCRTGQPFQQQTEETPEATEVCRMPRKESRFNAGFAAIYSDNFFPQCCPLCGFIQHPAWFYTTSSLKKIAHCFVILGSNKRVQQGFVLGNFLGPIMAACDLCLSPVCYHQKSIMNFSKSCRI